MDPQFWNGRKVFITGHTGFKGSWLALWLQRLGADVVGYALPPAAEPSMFAVARVDDGITSIEGDIRDEARLREAMARHRPEVVIHLAAQALVRASYTDPVTTYTTNVIGTLNVLEAVRHTPGVRVALAITSDKCYENRETLWGYRESDPMGGHDPYSSSKGCAELLVSAYRDSYFPAARFAEHGVALASTRAGNVIGGGDWSVDRLVPDIVRAIAAGKPVLIRRPHATRPWQFVLEPLRGYLDLAERLWEDGPRFVGGWNFGPDLHEVQPVQWIVERLTSRWGDGASWQLDGADHPHEAHLLTVDCTKARQLLGWRPALDLSTALDWIVEWYRSAHHGEDLRAITELQLDRYAALLGAAHAPDERARSRAPGVAVA